MRTIKKVRKRVVHTVVSTLLILVMIWIGMVHLLQFCEDHAGIGVYKQRGICCLKKEKKRKNGKWVFVLLGHC